MARIYRTLERNQAGILQDRYGCAWCWNRLIVGKDAGGDFIDCGTPECRCDGFVTLKHIEFMLNQDQAAARIARDILKDALPWVQIVKSKVRHSMEFNMSALGF